MSLSRWLSQFKARLQSKKRARRRPIQTLSGLYDWVLEDRCLMSSAVVPAPEPGGGWAALNTIMWDGAKTPINPGGITFPSNVAVPTKTVTFTNTTDQTIYPFLRDANSGIGAGSNSGLPSGAYYDPQDNHNQEFRLYVGYVQNGSDYLGLLPHSSITVRSPLVFWNAENTYIATDGTNLIPTQTGQLNPFTYDPTSTRGISPITSQPADGYWVTNYTTPDSSSTAGFVMMYNAATASTPALPAPAQLAEFTIRDPFLAKLGLTSKADTQVLIDYDVSYVDNAIAPITMEASAVPVQIPPLYPDQSPNPPAPSFGWTGSTLSLTAIQKDIQNFVNNTQGTTAYIGQYFTNPNSPPPSPSSGPPPGWPAYYAPPPAGSTKIPGGQNVFLQSPLNGTTSSLDPSRYMLTSGGTEPISMAPGGDSLATGRPTQLPLTLDPAQRNALAAQLHSMLQTGNLNLALSTNPNTTIGQVSNYDSSGKLRGFAIVAGGTGYTSNLKYKLSGGGVPTSATGTASVKSGHISLVKLPNTGGGGIYTSAPSLTFTSGGGGGTGAQVYADIGGGTATVALNDGVTLPTGKGLTYIFSRPVTDYAATDITDLWYTWAQYYINQYASFKGETVAGTLTLQGTADKTNQAAFIAVNNDDLAKLTTPLAVGMTVKGGSISAAAGTNVTIVSIQKDPNTPNTTDFYLSQLQSSGGSTSYTFGAPQALPYSDPTGIENISVTNGGTGYVSPLTVSLDGGNGAGATATALVNGSGQITGFNITNPGGNYTFAPTVVITGGGGSSASATAVITNGQVTGFKDIQGGSGYSLGTTVAISGGGGTGASATAVVNPKTGAVTGIVLTNPGHGYSQGSLTVTINANNATGTGATATATVGSYVSTYANLLPDPTTVLQGGTVLQFAGSVYEALEAEASIPPAQSLRFYNAVMPPPVGLVGTTIGSDLGDLPNSNGGASVLGGQVRDLIKSILRGVWNFEAVPEVPGPTNPWYPNPSKPVGNLHFNPFNLDPYVWFIHDVLGMSGYGFSTDDDIANVGAFTSPYATDPSKTILPNNLVITLGGGTNTLPQPQQWFPGVPWGDVKTTGTVSTSGGKAFVTLAPGGKVTPTLITQYYKVIPVTPGQSGGAYVIGPGIPTGTTINIRNLESNLSFTLNVPQGETVTPSGGTVNLTFSGKSTKGLSTSPPPVASPPPASSPPPANSIVSSSAPSAIQEFVQLAEDEFLLAINQVVMWAEIARGIVPNAALQTTIDAYANDINANPYSQTFLGQALLDIIFFETLKLLMESPAPI